MKGNEDVIAELDNLLKFTFFGKEFKGIHVPLNKVEFEYGDNGKLSKTIESYAEEVPVISEYIYDENDNCIMTKSYKGGLIKPKDSDVVIGISKYDDQNRLIYVNSAISERTISYIDDNTTAIKEVNKVDGTISTTMINKENIITQELVTVNGVEVYELYRDYNSESAKQYNGYDEVRLKRNEEGKIVETTKNTYDDKDRLIVTKIHEVGYHFIDEKEYCDDYPSKVKHEKVTINDEVMDDINYDYNHETDEYTITGKYKTVTRSKADEYHIIKYFMHELKNELTSKIIDLGNDKIITILYDHTNGSINAIEYVDNINDNVFAFNNKHDTSVYEMVDCDIKIDNERFTVNKYVDDPLNSTRYIYQKFNEDGKVMLQDTINSDSEDLAEYIHSLIMNFIKSEGLDNIIFKEGGINVTEQFKRIGREFKD